MKRLIAIVLTLWLIIPGSAFACGPMTGHSGHTGSSGGGKNSKRDQWTKKRLQELKKRRQEQKGRGFDNSDVRGWPFGINDNPYVKNDMAELRRRDAVRRQRLADNIEFLMLKKERGELSPQGEAKLRAMIQQYRTNYR